MKHVLLALLFPMALTAQTMQQLTEQLGKTVLYGYEFWHALKTLGVPTQLIFYPGEGHLFIKPEHQVDRMD